MTIGEHIRSARKKAGLTQAQLSEKSGVAAISIHQYEAGKRQPQLEQLLRISSALNVDIIDLVGLEDELSGYGFIITDKGNHNASLLNQKIHSVREVYNYLSGDEKSEFWHRVLTPLHAQLNEAFNELNDVGRQKVTSYAQDLTRIPEYQREKPETAPETPPAPQEGKDTTPPPDAPETAPEGK